jgi:hypothetical protein
MQNYTHEIEDSSTKRPGVIAEHSPEDCESIAVYPSELRDGMQ